MIAWIAILLIGVGTFLIRASFLFAYQRIDLPDRAERALELVPAAVLSALVVPRFLAPEGAVAVVGNDRLLAGVVAAAVAWRTENILATILVGMAVLLGLGWFPELVSLVTAVSPTEDAGRGCPDRVPDSIYFCLL